jgi:hypothetical protein
MPSVARWQILSRRCLTLSLFSSLSSRQSITRLDGPQGGRRSIAARNSHSVPARRGGELILNFERSVERFRERIIKT